jgi:hypothetical protein
MQTGEGKSLVFGVIDAVARSTAHAPEIAKKLCRQWRHSPVRPNFVLPFAVAVLAISCSSEPTGPSREITSPNDARRLETPITVVPLHRTSPLPTPESASARIGILGGQLSLPNAGLTVVVPPLAVVTPVTIAATALAGSDVAYEFSPHGLLFLTPLVATQDLRNTEAQSGGLIDPLLLSVGYFPDAGNITSVTELLDVQVNLLSQTSTALLSHFSGYMWSSGVEGDDGGAVTARRRASGAVLSPSPR